jgi:tRNA threonylcarbamoyladenosine biosynthesis protein TsaE
MEPLTVSFLTRSADKTRELGVSLGRLLRQADFVALLGELGAGKTEFARGLAQGAGVPLDEVASPTFALIHRYQGRIPVVHADLFRLSGDEELYGTGYFELRDSREAALIVEWADRIPSAVPEDAVVVRLSAGQSPEERRLSVTSTGAASRARLDEWHRAAAAFRDSAPKGDEPKCS